MLLPQRAAEDIQALFKSMRFEHFLQHGGSRETLLETCDRRSRIRFVDYDREAGRLLWRAPSWLGTIKADSVQP
jgi:hypothetical protein